ncbi:hypothetical protein Acr_12g0000600 [Actinidia rufa]|uniref:Integrase catalytic domain-containing protein n=1 Tax=Actinidia rufa TaxID=165716 RepID=A0A7J0FH82_9ERIC|nr:hypothetical protein Acr_12g0000600 [Actinidia rufa]
MYYVSKVLFEAETRYLKIKKLAYALLIAARKLRHYFQAHPIVVLTNQPLKQILQRLDTSRRLLKWSIELSEFHIDYRPRMAIKDQALAYFMDEFTYDVALEPEGNLPEVLQTPSGEYMEYAICIGFKASNNGVEYETLLTGLKVVAKFGIDSLDEFSDSQLVLNQVQGYYLAKDARMVAYLDEVMTISEKIKDFRICQIPREETRRLMLWPTSLQPSISSRTRVIISNNVRQFNNDGFKQLYSDLAISHHFSSPGHPQANSQVEVTNRIILRNLKTRLENFKGMPSFRTSNFNEANNETELELNFDLLDEKRE